MGIACYVNTVMMLSFVTGWTKECFYFSRFKKIGEKSESAQLWSSVIALP